MEASKTLIYDGSFNGFLTAVYTAYGEKINVTGIQKKGYAQNVLFSEGKTVFTQMDQAKQVWNTIKSKSNSAIKNVYFAFLSERDDIEIILFQYIQKLLTPVKHSNDAFTQEIILKIEQLASTVSKEKRRLENTTGFQLTKDEVYFSVIEPNFNVLPLISKHFRSHHSKQEWIIYDRKREYGLYYNLRFVEFISLNLSEIQSLDPTTSWKNRKEFSSNLQVWENYFSNTSIKSQINKKLYNQHLTKENISYLSQAKEAI